MQERLLKMILLGTKQEFRRLPKLFCQKVIPCWYVSSKGWASIDTLVMLYSNECTFSLATVICYSCESLFDSATWTCRRAKAPSSHLELCGMLVVALWKLLAQCLRHLHTKKCLLRWIDDISCSLSLIGSKFFLCRVDFYSLVAAANACVSHSRYFSVCGEIVWNITCAFCRLSASSKASDRHRLRPKQCHFLLGK